MKKLLLRLDDLAVDSFEIDGNAADRGTVAAHYGAGASGAEWTCLDCPTEAHQDSGCATCVQLYTCQTTCFQYTCNPAVETCGTCWFHETCWETCFC